MGLLRSLIGILSIVAEIYRDWRDQRIRDEAREKAIDDIAKADVKATQRANEIIAEPRPDDDAARRMRNGSF